MTTVKGFDRYSMICSRHVGWMTAMTAASKAYKLTARDMHDESKACLEEMEDCKEGCRKWT